MAIAYFHNEILRRSGVAAFPAAYDDLEYSIKDNKSNIENLPPYVPEPSSIDVDLLIDIKKMIKERISPEYDNDRVRLAVHELYDGIFEGVAVECRETLANIQAHLSYRNLPDAEKEQIKYDVAVFFARRYTSFVAIVDASDTSNAAAASRSLRIRHNEEIISNVGRSQLLILPDNHILSTNTGRHQLRILPYSPDEGFDFIAPLLSAKNMSPENEGDLSQAAAKGELLALNLERWGELRRNGINRA